MRLGFFQSAPIEETKSGYVREKWDLVLPVVSRPHLNAWDAVAGSADDQAGA